jgi:hypothetical protein
MPSQGVPRNALSASATPSNALNALKRPPTPFGSLSRLFSRTSTIALFGAIAFFGAITVLLFEDADTRPQTAKEG